MKCYICLTDSISTRKDYLDLLKVTLISARKNTSLQLICLYDGQVNDPTYRLLESYGVEILLHTLPYKQELMEIYPHEWMVNELGKVIDYNRIFGTFMRMEIPAVEKEDEYVLYCDMDVLFLDDIRPEDLPRPAYLAAAPEFEKDATKMTYFNAGVLLMNIQGMQVKRQEFLERMRKRERNTFNLFDQGYLNELCFKDMEVLPVTYNWKPYWGIEPHAKLIHFHGMKPGSQLHEAGFTTDSQFFKEVFRNNPDGYAGYVYYFILFFRYLGEPDNLWLYQHLQSLFNLIQPSMEMEQLEIAFTNSQKRLNKYHRKYKLFKRLFIVSTCLAALLILYQILA